MVAVIGALSSPSKRYDRHIGPAYILGQKRSQQSVVPKAYSNCEINGNLEAASISEIIHDEVVTMNKQDEVETLENSDEKELEDDTMKHEAKIHTAETAAESVSNVDEPNSEDDTDEGIIQTQSS